MAFGFWENRRHRGDLKIALETDLKRLRRPSKRGRTIDGYFAAMVQFVQDFCRHKIDFLNRYEASHPITFSAGFRRRYLAKAFDSLVQDLHRIVTEYLEIDFVLALHRSVEQVPSARPEFPRFWQQLETRLGSKAEQIFEDWYDKPLNRFLEEIIKEGDFDDRRREQLWQAHRKACSQLKLRSRNLIRNFCTISDSQESARRFAQILGEQKSQFPSFLNELKKQGFRLGPEARER